MPKSAWMLATVAAGVLLTGCWSTACQDLATAYAGVDQKARPCLERAPLPAFDPDRCEQNLQACTGQDIPRLEAQVECYQRLGTCQPEQKAAFLQSITDCDSLVLSNACEAAIF